MQNFQVKVTTDIGDSKQQIASLQRDINVLTGEKTVKLSIDQRGLNLDILKNLGEQLKTLGKPINLEFKQGAQVVDTFKSIQANSKIAKNTLIQTYKITRDMDGPIRRWDMGLTRIGRNAAKVAKATGNIWNNKDVDGMLGSVFKGAAASAGVLVSSVAKIGFALFGLNEIIGLLRAAWGGFFRETIGREVELRDSILRTRAALASTSKVFVNEKEITDPYEKILKLAKPVDQAINGIIMRSIELAGVTSVEVVGMFNIVAANISKVGGTLKDAEDLAFAFAAGMGTLGMPGYMAPQEINSVLGGYIDRNSRLAQALQISNEDISRARGQEGGVVEFLKKRLEAVVAGQSLAAKGFTGVVSNIKDLYELTTQNFGAGLLDPLIAGLTVIFDKLNSIRDQVFKVAKGFGTAISSTATVALGMFTRGRRDTKLDNRPGNIFDNRGAALKEVTKDTNATTYQKKTLQYFDSLGASIRSSIQNAFVEIGKAFTKFQPTLLILADALRSLIQSFADIKVGTFNALVSALAAAAEIISRLSPAIAMLVNLWAKLLNTPLVKYFYEVTTTLRVLKAAGGDILLQGFLVVRFILSTLGPALLKIVKGGIGVISIIQAINSAVSSFTGSIGATISGFGDALAGILPAGSKGPQQIKDAGANISFLATNLENTNKKLDTAKGKLKGLGLGMRALGLNTLFFFGKLLLVQLAIAAVVDAIGKYNKAQEDTKSAKEAGRALGSLQRNYADLNRSLTAAEEAEKSYKESLVNTEYDKAIAKVRELKGEINELKYELNNPGIQSFGELWRSMLTPSRLKGGLGSNPALDQLTKEAIERLKAEAAATQPLIDAVNRDRDIKQADEDVRVTGENRKNGEKEIQNLRTQIERDVHAQRQELARAELDIFRAQEEMRIRAIDRANKKLMQNEEGIVQRGLDAINNYFQVREKGELSVESSRREAQLDAADVERKIIDYRIEMEKTILDIRNRAGINEVKAAEAAARARTAKNPTGEYGGVFDTGLRTGPSKTIGGSAPYHQDLSFGPGVDLRQQRQLLVSLAEGYKNLGKEIVLSNSAVYGRKFPLTGTVEEQNKFILDGQAAHRSRNGGTGRTALDFYTPDIGKSHQGPSVVNKAMYAPIIPGGKVEYTSGKNSGHGMIGKDKDDKTIYQLIHSNNTLKLPSNRSMPAAPPAAAIPSFTPAELPGSSELPNAKDITAQQAAMSRQILERRNKLRNIQAQVANAETVSALEEIGRSTFQLQPMQELTNETTRLKNLLEQTKDTSDEAFNPQLLDIQVNALTEITTMHEALLELRRKLPTMKGYQPGQDDKILSQFDAAYKLAVARVRDRALAQDTNRQLQNNTTVATDVKQATRSLPLGRKQEMLQSGFGLAQAYDPTNAQRSRLLLAELAVLQRKLDLEQELGPLTESQILLLNQELEARKSSAEAMAQFDEQIKAVATQLELARGAAQAVTEGHKQLAQDILSGNDPAEAMGNALKGTTDKIMGMLLDQAFKPMEEQLFKGLRDLFKIEDPAELAKKQVILTAKEGNKPLIDSQTVLKTSIDALTTSVNAASGLTSTAAATGSAPVAALPSVASSITNLYSPGGGGAAAVAPIEAAKNYSDALKTSAENIKAQGYEASQTTPKTMEWGKALGATTQVLGALAMGIAGAQSISEGGTYNTLMGIAGIFGALGSITGMFGTGGIFAPKGQASGGPVSANRPYLVGEIGPELFLPNTDGEIVSNAKSRKLMSAAALAGKSQTFASNTGARQKANPSSLHFDFAYQSEVINSVEYVTSDQFRKGMSDSAERGKNMAFQFMQNSVSTRRRLGL